MNVSGTYSRYKQLTLDFISWIIKTSTKIDKDSKKLSNTIKSLLQRVEVITSSPFPKSNLREIVKTLNTGSECISLREQVHSLYKATESAESEVNVTHAHFINALRECHNRLRKWVEDGKAMIKEKESHESGDTTGELNRLFAGLEIHDLEPESNHEALLARISAETSRARYIDMINNLRIDEIDKANGNVKLIVLSFFCDLERIFSKVEAAWIDVKNEVISPFTATAITVAAVDFVRHIWANVEVKLNIINCDFFFLYSMLIPEIFTKVGRKMVMDRPGLSLFFDTGQMLLAEEEILIAPKLRMKSSRHGAHYPAGYFGPSYGENGRNISNSSYPERYNIMRVLGEEINRLLENHIDFVDGDYKLGIHEELLYQNPDNDRYHQFPVTGQLMKEFTPFFDKGTISVPLVFICQCWYRSITIMEDADEMIMAKTRGLIFHSTTKLRDNDSHHDYQAVAKLLGKESQGRQCNHHVRLKQARMRYGAIVDIRPTYHNLVLTGAMILDVLVANLWDSFILVDGLFSFHKGAAHLYHALRQENFIAEPIPLMEQLLGMYKDQFFVGGNLPERGCYSHSYMLSNQMISNPAAHRKGSKLRDEDLFKASRNERFDLRRNRDKLSTVRQVLVHRDYSRLAQSGTESGRDSDFVNSLDELRAASEYELFGSRVLSFDPIALTTVLYDLFKRLNEAYPRSAVVNKELPISITMEVTIVAKALYIFDKQMVTARSNTNTVEATFAETIAIIMNEELHKYDDLDSFLFFLIPPSPKQRDALFGNKANRAYLLDNQVEKTEACRSKFEWIMNAFRAGPEADVFKVQGSQGGKVFNIADTDDSYMYTVALYKELLMPLLRESPHLMLCSLDYLTDEPYQTIFDYVLFHPKWKNYEMAEWMNATGYVFYRDDSLISAGAKCDLAKCSSSHLQRAVRYGSSEEVYIVLTMTQAADINYQCPLDGNTALHYAVLRQNAQIILRLLHEKASPLITNLAGIRPFDLPQATSHRRTYADMISISEQEAALVIVPMPIEIYCDQEGHISFLNREFLKRASAKSKQPIRHYQDRFTAEQIASASKAEAELVAMLDREEEELKQQQQQLKGGGKAEKGSKKGKKGK